MSEIELNYAFAKDWQAKKRNNERIHQTLMQKYKVKIANDYVPTNNYDDFDVVLVKKPERNGWSVRCIKNKPNLSIAELLLLADDFYFLLFTGPYNQSVKNMHIGDAE